METIRVRELHGRPAAGTPGPISRADLVILLNRHAPDPTFAADVAALTSDDADGLTTLSERNGGVRGAERNLGETVGG